MVTRNITTYILYMYVQNVDIKFVGLGILSLPAAANVNTVLSGLTVRDQLD